MTTHAPANVKLVGEVNAVFPNRHKGPGSSDGWLGDEAHQNRVSDHNPDDPNPPGVVRAQDIDEDLDGKGVPTGQAKMARIAEHIRRLGAAGDPRLNAPPGGQNGYVIYEGRIAGAGKGWAWRKYTGPNAHKLHIHVSLAKHAAGYNSRASWRIKELFDQQEEDDMPNNVHYYKIRDEDNISEPHPTKGEAIWKTDETFTHAVSLEAWVHMTGMGWRDENVELIPESLHDWFVQNNKDLNEG